MPAFAHCNAFFAVPFVSTVIRVITSSDHISPCVIKPSAFFAFGIAESISKTANSEHGRRKIIFYFASSYMSTGYVMRNVTAFQKPDIIKRDALGRFTR